MQPTPNLFVHRERGGHAPALVFTHGYLESSETTWANQLAALRDRAPLVTWDLPGHGRSPERADYSLSVVMADLESVIEGTGGDVVLVGHSLGGYASLRRAILDPSRIRALVLVATGPGFRSEQSRLDWNRSVEEQALRAGGDPGRAGLAKHDDTIVMDRLDEVAMPVLVIAGEKDRAFAGATAYFAKKLPHARTVVVPDAGHMVTNHQPEAVNRAILGLLDGL